MGALQQRLGADFEKTLELSFDAYLRADLASIDFMPIPTYQTGIKHPTTHQPLLAPKGRPPFDAYGYWHKDATMIGGEFKSTYELGTSLKLVMPDKGGDGVQFHQLDALAKLAMKNGLARIVWNNGGMIGVLQGAKIISAYETMLQAIKTESRPGMKAPIGSKSIPWSEFRVIQPSIVGQLPIYDWIMLDSII